MTSTTAAPRAAAVADGPVQALQAVPVQPHGGLVQGEDCRFAGQDGGQGQQPLLRRRQFRRVRVRVPGSPTAASAACARAPASLPQSRRQAEADLPQHRPLEQLVPGMLEEQAHRRGHAAGRDAGDVCCP